ncbi:MAG: polyphosphate kinase 1 [bacterium]|nr:polyphosphate kinase 1 [bacterium]
MPDIQNKGEIFNMSQSYYRNRELSWLDFDKRVLEEAQDLNNPLCERMTFASIFKSNLDEFFMVRFGMLHDSMLFSKNPRENKTNMTASEQIDAVLDKTRELTAECDKTFADIMTDAEKQGIKLVNFKSLTEEQAMAVEDYFNKEIKPLLSPQIVGKRHPFPFLKNKEIYVLVTLKTKNNNEKIGIVPCGSNVFKRLIPINGIDGVFMLAEELILHYAAKVFDKYKVKEKTLMRIIRNADIDTEDAYNDEENYRDMMERIIKQRKKLCPIKLELSRKIDDSTVKAMSANLDLTADRVFYSSIPLDLSFVFDLQNYLSDKKELFYSPRVPQKTPFADNKESMIAQIKKNDILLSYPYESMKPFFRLLSEAANDDAVVSIKMTLYRVAKYSKIVETLIEAAENGKEVVVLVELRARFDEENNIEWSKRLEEAGCRIIYGLEHLKVHSKLCLITRKENNSIEYITQIGTGNYNEKTSKQYTDYSLMTASADIGMEAANVLNELAMGQVVERTKHLLVAPKCLQNKILAMIDEEIAKAKENKPAYIGAKINSLTDKKIIDRLVEASQAGVKTELIVRGICCLIPGVQGYTDNITVISIVGRYLEHSRIYIFGAEPDCKVYISSADYMTRNTLHRVEVGVPVYDERLKIQVLEMFNIMLDDNVKARRQMPDSTYVKLHSDNAPLNSQEYFYNKAYKNAPQSKN